MFVLLVPKLLNYMKYLLLLLSISILSCNKDNDQPPPKTDPPTVTNVTISSEIVLGTARPKFTITLKVPDTAALGFFYLWRKDYFPSYRSTGTITKPKSGDYSFVDSSATYPPSNPIQYFTYFDLKSWQPVSYQPFELK